MKIGDLAKQSQCTVETVRYYEKKGLLPAPERTEANYRRFTQLHVERLRFIRNCRSLDMSLDEILRLIGLMDQASGDCGGVNLLLDDHIDHVDERMSELSQLKQQLLELRQRCQQAQTIDSCGILQELTSMEAEPKPERHTHLG
jgi:Cd(II)/Pb(II)-responsive transcriptional regulator